MIVWPEKARDKGYLTPHDVTTGIQIAMVVIGGDIKADGEMYEQDLFELERKSFTTLAQTPQTRARSEHMLSFGNLLRN